MPRLDSGEPLQLEVLDQEIAAPSVTGVRTVWHSSTASGLTPEELGAVLRSVDDRGDATDYLTLAEEMEERDLHYASVLRTRKLGVSSLEMVIESASDEPQDIEQADFIHEVLDTDAMRDATAALLDALGKGYSALEIIWDQSRPNEWLPQHLVWRDPRFFRFDREQGCQLMIRDAQDFMNGLPLPPYKFIVHEPKLKTGIPIRGGLARLAVIAFMCKGYTLKDWLAFAEVFGMPFRLGKYSVTATPEQKSKLLTAVTNIGIDAAAIIPEDMMIEFIETQHATGGDKLFQGLADWLDRQVSKGVLGQTASTEGTPGRLGGDDAQDEVRKDIRDDDAMKLAATLRRDLIKPIIDLNFGVRDRPNMYPRIKFIQKEKEDLKMLSEALPPFIDRGLPVEQKTILDKFGLPMPDMENEETMLLEAKGGGGGFGASPSTPVPDDPGDDNNNGIPDDLKDSDEDVETMRRRTVKRLLAKAESGQSLSETEWEVLAICQINTDDEIDKLAKQRMKKWREIMGPILDPILAVASRANSFGEVEAAIGQLPAQLDVSNFVRTLALETFRTRAMGNATDKIKL